MSGAGEEDDYLEDYYDAIVLSTGLSSSILAAALAKAGKSVLYLDCHEYYGQESASLSFTQLLDWAESNHSKDQSGNIGVADSDGNGGPTSESSAKDSAAAAMPFTFDRAAVGSTIARAHVRNEIKKQHDAEAAAAEEKEALAGGSSTESKNVEPGPEGPATTKEDQATDEQEGHCNDASAQKAAAALEECSVESSEEEQNPPRQQQHEQEEDKKSNAEEVAAEKAIEDAAAEDRLKSLDLHLLPLSYHGCRTRAGAPSDTCVSERRRRKAAEDAAATSGRFLGGRQPQPSHPAWAGRREPTKEEGERAVERLEEGVHPSFWGYRTERRPKASDLVRLSRSFNVDLTSQVLLATGPAVDALVSSGVASYLEFKDMQALYLASDVAPASETGEAPAPDGKGGGGEGGGNGNGGGRDSSSGTSNSSNIKGKGSTTPRLGLSRVPCSKADVFGTKLLTPLEKRRFMKFLLFASDWGLQRAGEDVLARNEAGLGKGRSLRRPQNREAASGDFDAYAYAGKPFAAFLRSCGLPERVRAMITHALALLPGDGDDGRGCDEERNAGSMMRVTTEEGLEAVCRHLSALGRFGETAFITPLYGVGELSQSFCRMAAVHGAICMLRRQLKGAVVDRVTGRCVGVVDDTGRAYACASLVVGGEFFAESPGPYTAATAATTTKAMEHGQQPSPSQTTRPPVPGPLSTPLAPPPPASASPPRSAVSRNRARLLRRVVLASGPVAPEGRGRGLCVLPPGLESVGNPAAVHVVSLDESTAVCPGNLDGACVLHLTTTTTTTMTLDPTGSAGAEVGEANDSSSSSSSPAEMATAKAVAAGDIEAAGWAEGVGLRGVFAAVSGDDANARQGAEENAGEGGVRRAMAGEQRSDGLPVGFGATADGRGILDDENGRDGVLGRAARELLAAAGVEEIWSLGFSWDIRESPRTEDLPSNMVVCERPGQELYLHDVVVQAEHAFARLCPGKPFWPPPSTHTEDEGDDQAEMLKAAASAVTTTDADEDGEQDLHEGGVAEKQRLFAN